MYLQYSCLRLMIYSTLLQLVPTESGADLCGCVLREGREEATVQPPTKADDGPGSSSGRGSGCGEDLPPLVLRLQLKAGRE